MIDVCILVAGLNCKHVEANSARHGELMAQGYHEVKREAIPEARWVAFVQYERNHGARMI